MCFLVIFNVEHCFIADWQLFKFRCKSVAPLRPFPAGRVTWRASTRVPSDVMAHGAAEQYKNEIAAERYELVTAPRNKLLTQGSFLRRWVTFSAFIFALSLFAFQTRRFFWNKSWLIQLVNSLPSAWGSDRCPRWQLVYNGAHSRLSHGCWPNGLLVSGEAVTHTNRTTLARNSYTFENKCRKHFRVSETSSRQQSCVTVNIWFRRRLDE